jgi:hypothetical protein
MNTMTKRIILFALALSACKQNAPTEEAPPLAAKVSVETTGIRLGEVSDELTFFATTLYLRRNVVTAPIPAFITKVLIKLGESVREGQVLYQLETKERRAIGDQKVTADSSFAAFGKIFVRASASGIISTLDKQQLGDYVLEGTQLCTIAENGALAFSVNVPYEYKEYAKTGTKATLELPDSTRYPAVFTAPLTTMNPLAQTQTILAKSDAKIFLPENLIVKIIVNKNTGGKHQLLPRTSVLSDEMLKNFWVMKLTNDSTAVKIPVTLGNRNHEQVEILSPAFNAGDQFLTSGNYGLPDTAYVKINHQ